MVNITKTYIEKEVKASAEGKQVFHFDDQIKGFGIRATAGSKTFILDRKLNGKTIRTSIGRFPDWTVQQARERARELIVELDRGNDIREQARQKADAGETLRTVSERFFSEKLLKPRTQTDYRRYINFYLSDWLDKPLSKIDADMVMARYKKIGTSSSGEAQASSVMRFLRSIFNFAIATYGRTIIPENVVASITEKRAWYREKPKTDHLSLHQIKPFIRKLRALPNATMAAYIEFMVFTGARRSEAALLKWKDVDLKAKTITFKDTKNHTDRVLPLTPHVAVILDLAKQSKVSEYVFGSFDKNGKPTYIKEPRKAMAIANAAAESVVTVHGLRRTFCTILESLDCPGYPLKALMGHSVKGDVTGTHYTQMGVERLRPWLEKYEGFMLSLMADGAQAAQHVVAIG